MPGSGPGLHPHRCGESGRVALRGSHADKKKLALHLRATLVKRRPLWSATSSPAALFSSSGVLQLSSSTGSLITLQQSLMESHKVKS